MWINVSYYYYYNKLLNFNAYVITITIINYLTCDKLLLEGTTLKYAIYINL